MRTVWAPPRCARCPAVHQSLNPSTIRSVAALQDTAHVMSKVDKLLGEVCASGAASAASGGPAAGTSAAAAAKGVAVGASSAAASLAPEELEARCRLLDRVASEVSRLQFYSAKGDELEFMRQLRPRIKAAAEALQVRCWCMLCGAQLQCMRQLRQSASTVPRGRMRCRFGRCGACCGVKWWNLDGQTLRCSLPRHNTCLRCRLPRCHTGRATWTKRWQPRCRARVQWRCQSACTPTQQSRGRRCGGGGPGLTGGQQTQRQAVAFSGRSRRWLACGAQPRLHSLCEWQVGACMLADAARGRCPPIVGPLPFPPQTGARRRVK